NARAEYLWFAAGDLLPFTAMDATRAARIIVGAVRRGRTEIVLTWQARLLRLAAGVAPGLVTNVMSGLNRVLPKAPEADREAAAGRPASRDGRWVRGTEMEGVLPEPLMSALRAAGARSNE
ncbi:MAG TPA: hypothetical protein VK966_13805, partial [Longimicrobiales bacterium]|nr:hypothetical protein [Longimicrobiales bacterium]